MASKNVAIRLVAEGGERVRAEFKGIGEVGEKSFDGLGNAANRVGAIMRRVFVGLAATLGPAALFTGAMREAEQFETTMFRIDAIVKATGGAAGRSADELREQARAIARSTLESTEGVLRAQQTLLTFRKVQGDVFDDTIMAAADMAAALGTDMNAAVLQLGKALEDPVTGMTALTRSGTVFTEAQREMVKQMVETGRQAEAQRFILNELQLQYGGAARAAASGLAGAQDSLAQSMQEVRLAIANSFGVLQAATGFYNAMARTADFLAENMDRLRSYAIAAAAIFTAVKIPAIIAMTAAAGRLVVALVATRAAMLRTGVLALVVGAGELVFWFTKLVENAGGFGEALRLLAAVGAEVWDRLTQGGEALQYALAGAAQGIEAAFMSAWASVLEGFDSLTSGLAEGWNTFMRSIGMEGLATASGLGGSAAAAMRGRANELRGMSDNSMGNARWLLQDAMRPLDSVAALGEATRKATEEGAAASDRLADSMGRIEDAANRAGGAGRGAGRAAKEGADEAVTGWDAAAKSLRDYADQAMDVGKQVGDAMIGAFRGAESALRSWIEGGKLSFKDFARSIIADLAMISIRANFLGPLASWMGGLFNPSGSVMLSSFVSAAGGARADGGPVMPGYTYTVGERGRERFTPLVPGMITPTEHLRAGRGPAGRAVLEIVAPPGFSVQQRGEIEGIAINVTRAGLQEYDRNVAPATVKRITGDPRRRG